jgi:hypothetical protein
LFSNQMGAAMPWVHTKQELTELREANTKLKRLAVRLKGELKEALAKSCSCLPDVSSLTASSLGHVLVAVRKPQRREHSLAKMGGVGARRA